MDKNLKLKWEDVPILKKAYDIVKSEGEQNLVYGNYKISFKVKNDGDNDYCEEVIYYEEICNTYCENCIEQEIVELQADFDNGKIPKPDNYTGEVCYAYSGCFFETDEFIECNRCGKDVSNSILWNKDLLNWFLKDKDNKDWIEIFREKDRTYLCKLMLILEQSNGAYDEFPDETIQIAEKVIKFSKRAKTEAGNGRW